MLRLILAALFRAGEIEVTYQGQPLRQLPRPGVSNAFHEDHGLPVVAVLASAIGRR